MDKNGNVTLNFENTRIKPTNGGEGSENYDNGHRDYTVIWNYGKNIIKIVYDSCGIARATKIKWRNSKTFERKEKKKCIIDFIYFWYFVTSNERNDLKRYSYKTNDTNLRRLRHGTIIDYTIWLQMISFTECKHEKKKLNHVVENVAISL